MTDRDGHEPIEVQLEAQLAAVASHAHALDAYRAWLREQGRSRGDYLFTAARVRFEPRPGDVVTPRPGLAVEGDGDGAVLVAGEARIDVPGLRPSQVEALLGAMDGRCLLEVAWAVDEASLGSLLRAAFGKVLFAVEAVTSLHDRVSAAEIARFPVDPYAIERSYWDNMAAVAARLPRLERVSETASFWRELRRLHVVALMGEHLDSFYRPASPGAARGFIAPGALFLDPVRRRDAVDGSAVLLSGPRVRAKVLGSDAYVGALLGGLPAGSAEAGWGEVVRGRGADDPGVQDWFLPPRPITSTHLDAIYDAWLRRADSCARAELHWRFVRLHPFACGNQSLVMSLVNHARRCGDVPGLPHLVLDHWALCLPLDAYTELFARAEVAFGHGDFTDQVAQTARLQRVMGTDDPTSLEPADRQAGLLGLDS